MVIFRICMLLSFTSVFDLIMSNSKLHFECESAFLIGKANFHGFNLQIGLGKVVLVIVSFLGSFVNKHGIPCMLNS